MNKTENESEDMRTLCENMKIRIEIRQEVRSPTQMLAAALLARHRVMTPGVCRASEPGNGTMQQMGPDPHPVNKEELCHKPPPRPSGPMK
ncbi:hypothetical protein HWE04_06980 [Herbaspirillum sp. C7C2]|uniref:hypothetical protein n=1 Tax=Herbaspirillum sp. C7C2 TaxID=2736666 RepID=UPI001F52A003|nr:hypothetical protein [Herbaspirillum sp. C7C2]MCI1013588.1 hypothetical protein [Herbaspirillum sp. C7C2]